MKKSRTVRLTLMASMAVVACRREPERRCVDWNDQSVPETLCSEADKRPTPTAGHSGYRWIYIGGVHAGAAGVRSGAAPATDGAHPGVSRGGFGESAGAHSGASGAHGGAGE